MEQNLTSLSHVAERRNEMKCFGVFVALLFGEDVAPRTIITLLDEKLSRAHSRPVFISPRFRFTDVFLPYLRQTIDFAVKKNDERLRRSLASASSFY
jgi:hypothetical protein